MKKYLKFFYVALFAVLTLSVTSCKDNDDDEPNEINIVGTWKSIIDLDAITNTDYVRFNEGGVYEEVIVTDMLGMGEDITKSKGTWTLNGNKLTTKVGNKSATSSIVSSSKDKFVVEALGVSLEYRRISESEFEKYFNK